MRPELLKVILAGLLATVVTIGCSSTKSKGEPVFGDAPPPTAGGSKVGMDSKGGVVVTPAEALAGKVVSYNATGRFVVLNFPVGHMPALEQTLFVYRQGLKVGELHVTGPMKDDHIVADLTKGECRVDDDVRDR